MSQDISYKVYLKDINGIVVAIFDSWFDLKFSNRVNSPSFYTLTLDGYDPRVNLFTLDCQIEIWRRSVQLGIDWYLEFEGFHRSQIRKTNSDGTKSFTSNGRGYLDILSRRLVGYRSQSTGARKTGPSETVMKTFVLENVGISAISPPRVRNGIFPGLTVEADSGNGILWSGERSFKNILPLLQEISNVSNIDFSVVGTSPYGGPPSWEFRTHVGQLGEDRTILGLDPTTGKNSAGNVPIVFSLERGNMLSPQYSISHLDEVNVLFALGTGIGDIRNIVTVTNPTGIGASPYNEREGSRNGSSQKFTSDLIIFGEEWLQKLIAKENITFTVLQLPSIFYGLGISIFPGALLYHLGDRVTIKYETIEINKRIVGVDIDISGDHLETIKIIFGDTY